MKQAGYSKRPYGRISERQRSHQKQVKSESGDPKIRGNPQQVVEKYLTLARDAALLGDPVSAENYYQYADHYYRMALANRPSSVSPFQKHKRERENQPESVIL